MSRITTTVFIFLLLMNGSVSIMAQSGLSEDLGVELAPGIDDSMTNAIENVRQGFSPSAGLGETLFSMFLAALDVVNIFVNAVTAAPTMLMNLGFPAWIVAPLFAPMYVLAVVDLVYTGSGRDL